VRSFMAHHQGMSLAALDNYLNQSPFLRRFHADPRIAALELLLQERMPHHAPLLETYPEAQPEARRYTAPPATPRVTTRRLTTPHTFTPRAHVISNGAYQVMITNAGGGSSTCQLNGEQLAITRWREDSTRDDWGTFIYVRDLANQVLWSATYQPTGREPEEYEAVYAEDQATFRRRDSGIQTQTEIVVPPHDNLEIRRVTLTNTSNRSRMLEITSYAEVVLDSFRADLMHPAFSKLFIESEFLPEHQTLLFHRRPRAAHQPTFWAWHQLVSETVLTEYVTCETDRARFLGRGRTPRHPLAVDQPLTGTTGAILDPIMSLRCRVRLGPGQTARLIFITGAALSREAILTVVDKYDDSRLIADAFDLARSYAQIQLRHLGLTPEMAHLFHRLASRILYPDAALRAPAEVLIRNTQSQSGLWGQGLSGDHPIVLVRVDEAAELELVRHLLHAHEYWRLNNFTVDLVILNEHTTSYADGLHDQIQAIIDSSLSRPWLDKPGGVFLRRRDHLSETDFVLLQSVARVVLDGDLGSLTDQLQRSPREPELPPYEEKRARPTRSVPSSTLPAWPTSELLFPNSYGGFTKDGREYVITLQADHWTPAPWINVLANPTFGCLISESGLGYTWNENSQTNRLTPWSNDPVSDPPGEALYLRDDDTGEVWTPTPLPIRTHEATYVIRHGAGYSRFESTLSGLAHELLVFVPTTDPVKIMRLRVRNPSTSQVRHLALTHYAEWVLGLTRSTNQFFIVTEHDPNTGTIFARNSYNADFGEQVAFATCLVPTLTPFLVSDSATPDGKRRERRALRSFTADRSEFLGRNGSLAQPAALNRGRLSERVGAGLDPCAAQQIRLELKPGEEKEVVFLLGQAESQAQAREIIQRYDQAEKVEAAFKAGSTFWDDVLGVIQVETPEPALDILLNRWLLYQALVCRLWARSAFYQSGGAYGFRDQLQDVMALVHARPELTREHILRAAAHQFAEGDVQHWWHPQGPGIRTRFSDDYLWLPFVVQHYVKATGDTALLDEEIPFLKAPVLEPDQLESYLSHTPPGPTGSLYEHCRRALENGLKFGAHGLPLMGTGDWNDAMNRVGEAGRGESVWLAWFLYSNLNSFAEIADLRHDSKLAERYRAQAKQLHQAIEANAWDGAWYQRAYFDDGTPLGSAQNAEGQIDLIAQAWAVLSGAAGVSPSPARRRSPEGDAVAHQDGAPGAAPANHIRSALAAVEKNLVREEDRLVLLLTPPFNTAEPDPGYIRGYLPGIRENGGQYTHAAIWLAWAYAALGDGDRATALFNLLSPIYHARSAEDVARYKVEPYVVAADVYAQPQHLGRGGWTWYTGSASWMYRLGIEAILGLQRAGDTLHINPSIPHAWLGFKVNYRFGQTRYEIKIENTPGVEGHGVKRVELDGVPQVSKSIPLQDDGLEHRVKIVLGA
jgi:cyclic beta-1,2-glucan synthetase